MFIAPPRHWARNLDGSRTLRAQLCQRTDPEDNILPGVAVFASGRPVLILDPEDALRLASQIADVLAERRAAA